MGGGTSLWLGFEPLYLYPMSCLHSLLPVQLKVWTASLLLLPALCAFFTTMDSGPLKPKVKANILKLLLVMEFIQSNKKIANTLVSCSMHPRAISQLQYQASRLKIVSKVVSSLEYAGNLSRSGHIDLFLSHTSELYYSLGIKMFFKGVYNYLHSSFF